MKNLCKFFLFFLAVIVLISCKERGAEKNKQNVTRSSLEFPIKIDMEKLIKTEFKEIGLSTVADSIEYIPLETTQGSLIKEVRQVVLADSFIFVLTNNKILKFNRKGEFLRQIGSLGKGPGEYLGVRNINIDDNRKILFIFSNYLRKLIKYTYNNAFISDIPLFVSDLASFVSFTGKNHFAAFGVWTPPDWKTEDMFLAAILDSSGRVIQKIDSPLRQFDNFVNRKDIQYPGTFLPTYFDSAAICLGYGCDTIYTLTHHSIEPKYILNLGKYNAPADIKFGFGANMGARIRMSEKKYNYIFLLHAPIETREYLFLHFSLKGYMYLAAFNKFKGETTVFRKKGNVRNGVIVNVYDIGFKNDLDGGLYFYPRWVNLKGDVWIAAYNSFELKSKLTKNQQSLNAKYPEKHKSLIQLANKLNENDNPVLMIAHVK